MADIKREDVLKYLENSNMLEISELISEIEDKFGVSAAAPVAVAAAGGEAGGVPLRGAGLLRRQGVAAGAHQEALLSGEVT